MWKKKMLPICLSAAVLASGLTLEPKRAQAAELIAVDPGIEHQTMDGWGTNLVWWAGQVGTWDEPVRREIMDLVFGEEGLDLNIIRYNFGGSSTDPELDSTMHPARKMLSRATSYDEATEEIVYDHENIDQGQEWVIKDLIDNYNVDYMEAQVNSPPWWMTISGSAAGNVGAFDENLAPENYDLFVRYLVEMLKHFKDNEGVEFDHIDPFNEPVSGYWKKGGNQEGAYFSPAVQQVIIKKLQQRLQEEGLRAKIVASDETSIDHSINTYHSFDQATKDMIERIQTHVYSGSKRYQLRDLALGEKKPLWMSEVSTGYVPFSLEKMEPAIPLANMIFKDLKDMGASAWVIWQAVEDRVENFVNLNKGPDYMTPWGVPGSWGLINADYSDLDLSAAYGPDFVFHKGDYILTKQYYVMKQFSKFIKPGYTIIETNSNDVIAATGPDGKLVLVVSNFTGGEKNTSFNLDKFDRISATAQGYRTSDTEAAERIADISIEASAMNVTLPPNSLTTYVIDQASYAGAKSKIINDNVKGTGSDVFSYSDGWTYYDSQSGNYSKDTHYANAADEYLELTFTGNRVKLYGTQSPDSGIAEISIDGGTPRRVDLYSGSRKDNALFFDSGILSTEGSHQVKVTVTGEKHADATDSYISIDRAVTISGDVGDAPAAPVVNSVAVKEKGIQLTFEGVAGASEYLVKYGSQRGSYNYVKKVSEGSALLTGLLPNTTYYAVVVGVVNGRETLPSLVVSSTYEERSDSGQTALAYYVDAGASATPAGLPLGDYNSVTDQAFGPDPVSGYSWGWTSDVGTGVSATGDRFQSVRYNAAAASGGISYKFELPEGKYKVQLGFSDPWGNRNRNVDIVLEGQALTKEYVAPAYPQTDILTYPSVEVKDGLLQVDVVRSARNTTQYTDPLISWLRVERYDRESPPGKPYIADLNASADAEATISFIEGSGADYYKIKYGTSPGVYTQETVLADGLKKTIPNLAPGIRYYFAIAGVNTYGEGELSEEASITTNAATAVSNLMYYTVLGGGALPSGEAFGLLQGPYMDPVSSPVAADAVTGYTWGITNRADVAGAWSTGPYGGFGYTNITAAGEGLTYSFELPNGLYDVSLGFHDPWGVTNRNMDIMINGTKTATENAISSGTKTYADQAVTNGVMTIGIVNPTPTQNVAPGLSMIKIKLKQGMAVNRKSLELRENEAFILKTMVKSDVVAEPTLQWTSSNEDIVTVENGVVHGVAAGTATIHAAVQGEADMNASVEVTVAESNSTTVPVANVSLNQASLTEAGNTTLQATVNPSNASNPAIVWTTDDPSIATVEANGLSANVSVLKPGRAIIRATSAADPSKYAAARIHVPVSVEQLSLNVDQLVLAKGQAAPLAVAAKPAASNVGSLAWESSDTNIATVDAEGNVTAVQEGMAAIKVTNGTVSASAVVTVRKPVTGVALDRKQLALAAGSELQLAAGVQPADATLQEVIWSSDKPAIASMDNNGKLTAHRPGIVTITVTTLDGYYKDTLTATVTAMPGGGTTTNPPTPTPTADPRAVTVSEQWLRVEAVKDKPTINIDAQEQDLIQVSLPLNAAELLGGKPLGFAVGDMHLLIPGSTLADLGNVLENSAGQEGLIALTIHKLAPNGIDETLFKAQARYNADIRAVGDVYEFKLEVIPAAGKAIEMTTFNEPLLLSLEMKSSSELAGIYYIGEDGVLTYVGGHRSGDKLEAELSHFSMYAVLEYEKRFEDLPAGHWAHRAVQAMAAKGIIAGVTEKRFNPQGDITRAEFSAMISRVLGLQAVEGESAFADVPSDSWYADAVGAAHEAGIVFGRSGNRFAPEATVTRQEMAAILVRAYKYSIGSTTIEVEQSSYSDEESISTWAKNSVDLAASLKLLIGSNGQFKPFAYTKRAEAAQAIFNLLNTLERA